MGMILETLSATTDTTFFMARPLVTFDITGTDKHLSRVQMILAMISGDEDIAIGSLGLGFSIKPLPMLEVFAEYMGQFGEYTSAQQRIEARGGEAVENALLSAGEDEAGVAGTDGTVRDPDGWLCPVCVDGDSEAKAGRNRNRRASNKGYLPVGFEDYLRILDWTGRQMRSDKRGAIPQDVRPVLERVGLRSESWVDCVENFGRSFHRAAGGVSLLADAAARAGRRWFHGVGRCRQAFA